MFNSTIKVINQFNTLPWKLILLFLLLIPCIPKAQTHIDEKGFVPINGIDQWVTIKGDRQKPVILFLHGGPGSPLSPYADSIFKGWEEEFILVQWDQRGSGKTFGRYAPAELSPAYLKENPLTISRMTDDGIALAQYILSRLGKQKIILFGTSWGSVLGVQMAQRRPDLFSAYIGHSQVVPFSENLEHAYSSVYHLAKLNEDQQSLATLERIGKPPYDTARVAGQLFRIIKKYERLRSTPAPEHWFQMAPAYDNEKDNQHRADGDDYSFVNYVGDKRLGVRPMKHPDSSLTFRLPVYFIQGEEDILTPKEITRKYFDSIQSPVKDYRLLPQAAHGFNASVVSALLEICRRISSNREN